MGLRATQRDAQSSGEKQNACRANGAIEVECGTCGICSRRPDRARAICLSTGAIGPKILKLGHCCLFREPVLYSLFAFLVCVFSLSFKFKFAVQCFFTTFDVILLRINAGTAVHPTLRNKESELK